MQKLTITGSEETIEKILEVLDGELGEDGFITHRGELPRESAVRTYEDRLRTMARLATDYATARENATAWSAKAAELGTSGELEEHRRIANRLERLKKAELLVAIRGLGLV